MTHMLPKERQNLIVQLVNEAGAASVKELSRRFSISEDSIRKDLGALSRQGLLKKTYGGALRLEREAPEVFVSQRKGKYLPDKRRIARKAVDMLEDGDIVFLDISTTSTEIARLLKTSGRSLTVVTNMIDVMMTMTGDEHNRLLFIGGSFNDGRDGFVGTAANRAIARCRFDKAFLGVAGIDLARGELSTYRLDDAATKEAIVARSRQNYLLLETRKLARRSHFVYASLREFAGVLTEKPLADDVRERIEACGAACL